MMHIRMCFSATASFAASGALTATGCVTMSKARSVKEIPFASIPLLFGIQQLLDGMTWISFGIPIVHTFAVYSYAIISQVFWPLWIPFSIRLIETNPARKKILDALLITGLAVAMFYAYFIFIQPVEARIVNSCILYDTQHPFPLISLSLYLITVCGSCFVSRYALIRFFGLLVLISFGIAGWFYLERFTSVWCFFAAVLSFMILWFETEHAGENPARTAHTL